MTASEQDLADLERAIGPRTNFRRLSDWDGSTLPFGTATLIRQWLIALDVPERKAILMTDKGLNNTYGAGRQFAQRLRSEDTEKRFGRPKRGPDLKIDLDEVPAEPKPAGLPLDLLGIETPKTQPETELREPVDGLHTTEAVKAAVEAIVPPRLNAIANNLQAALTTQIETKIREMAVAATISETLRTQIVDLATQTIQDEILRGLPKRIELRTPDGQIQDLPREPRHKVFEPVLKRLALGRHVYLVGGAGTGKTHLFKQLATALNRPVTILGQALTKYEFSGHIGPTGEYVKTLLRVAVEEGHLLAIDEIDMSAAAAIGFLNSLTANRYVAFPDRMIDAHPNFVVIAAANTTGHGATMQYVGRNPLDAASLDRFVYIECDYDEDLELQIFGRDPWVLYCQKVRAACRDLKQPHIVSMRAIERCLDGKALADSPDEIAQQGLWRNLAPDIVSKIKSIAGEPPRLRIIQSPETEVA